MRRHLLVTALVALGAAPSCTDVRSIDVVSCPNYDTELAPLLRRDCESCHGSALAEGAYRVDTQTELWARNAFGAARIMPGDAQSLLLRRAGGDNHVTAPQATLTALTDWVVRCDANPIGNAAVHPRGVLDRKSSDFHGTAVRAAGWSFAECETCHGHIDDATGAAGPSCLTCHAQGVTQCSTCHGVLKDPARQDAHRAHLLAGPALETGFGCAECHLVPTDWRDPGHLFAADGAVDLPPAEVILGAAANRSLSDAPERRLEPAAFDTTTKRCSNTYCHGGVLGDATLPTPVWTEVHTEASCSRCHAMPPAGSHPADLDTASCTTCHAQVLSENLTLVAPALHGDGAFTLGDGSHTCSACHGDAQSPAPDSGSHRTHLMGGTFAGPMTCAACHLMPAGDTFLAAVLAPGHIDSAAPAEVFPGGATFPGRAAWRGAVPNYNAANGGTCTNVYCHGGGTVGLTDTASGVVRALAWGDSGSDVVLCGSCHGIGPENAWHPLVTDPTACGTCHPLTVNDDGSIHFRPNGTTPHLNGVAE